MDAIILAGGFGTRLKEVIKDMPKPMADVNGNPFITYILDQLVSLPVRQIVLAVGYRYEDILLHFGESYKGIPLKYSIEKEPLGTGGCIKKALTYCLGDVLVLNGDSYFDISFNEMKKRQINTQADIVMASKKMYHVNRYGVLELKGLRVIEFKEKQEVSEANISCGIYLIKSDLFESFSLEDKFSIETEFLHRYVESLNIQICESEGYFIDIGIPEDYEKAQKYFLDGDL